MVEDARIESAVSQKNHFSVEYRLRGSDAAATYPDIARVVRGVEDDETIVRSDGREAVGLGVMRQSRANTIGISNRVRAQLDQIRPTLPVGMEVAIG
ncbi:MAG: efflux RND transporter permease subunit, partial [Oscillochloris sp.]|nr:efflux RND transporter permease subunit [Oscillochloris sp.]